MTTIFEHIFDIKPQVKQRPRLGKSNTYTAPKTAIFENHLLHIAYRNYKNKPSKEPLRVTLVFNFKRPKRPSRNFPSQGDLDNYIKCLDAFNGLIWVDDRQIVEIHASKKYAEKDSIYMKVERGE